MAEKKCVKLNKNIKSTCKKSCHSWYKQHNYVRQTWQSVARNIKAILIRQGFEVTQSTRIAEWRLSRHVVACLVCGTHTLIRKLHKTEGNSGGDFRA